MCMVMRRDNARRQGALWVIEIRLKLDMYVLLRDGVFETMYVGLNIKD